MSKQIQIPINEFDYFTSDGTYVGAKFRYRLKEDNTDNNTSQWSEPTELIFKNSDNVNISLSEANGYDFPSVISRANAISSYVWSSTNNRMMPSQIDQIISQVTLTSGNLVPKNDLYRLSFITPESFNVGKFDIFQTWRGVAYVHPTATISAPVGSSAPFTGTLTLSGTDSVIRAQTLKSYYDWYASMVSVDLPIYATQGTRIPGNTLSITGYSGSAAFAVKSASTWSASGNFTNISRINAATTPEYVATIPTNTYEFSRKMESNKVYATLIAGSSIVALSPVLTEPGVEQVGTSGLVPGMRLRKIAGDGRFSTDGNPVISQIDYQNNLLFLSYEGSETNTIAGTFTISSVSNPTAGVWTATINSSSLGANFEVGYMIAATPGTGSLGDGIVRVTSTNGSTQITLKSNKAITAGTVTNIVTIVRNNHGISGYIEFVGDASTQFNITYSGSTIKHNWLTQLFCQSIIAAPTKRNREYYTPYTNQYTVLSISENQFLYTGGLGEITSATTVAPFTARISTMSMPYSTSVAAAGSRVHANATATGGGSFGSGEVKVARYVSGNSIDLVSTAAITNGFVYGIRL